MAFFDIFKRKPAPAPQTEAPTKELQPTAPIAEPTPTPAPEPVLTVGEQVQSLPEITAPAEKPAVVAPEPTPAPVEKPAEVTPVPEPKPQQQPAPQPSQTELRELNAGLERTKSGLFSKLARAVAGRTTIDANVLDDLEEVLITSDVGVETTIKIIHRIEERVARDKYMGTSELQTILREEIAALLDQAHGSISNFGLDARPGVPFVVMVVGVNGAGKTTTIGKLAAKLTALGFKVWIGAADTFRAAAIDQLKVWSDRAGATMIHQEMGSDPASVAFDTLTSAKANGADVVLIDTAGRLHNKINLMNELTKIRNVMSKVIPDAPHEVMLVLDGSTGQNAFEQAKQFTQATQVTSLAITKLDGTAKGGVVIGISDQFQIPVRYIGIGEAIDQLRMFDRHEFVEALFGENK